MGIELLLIVVLETDFIKVEFCTDRQYFSSRSVRTRLGSLTVSGTQRGSKMCDGVMPIKLRN